MKKTDDSHLAEYESSTSDSATATTTATDDQLEQEYAMLPREKYDKYSTAKPQRIIIRARITHD